MPFSAESIKPPLHDQITELQRKIQLLEGDRSAYYESSQSTISKNRETILHLRQENKRLHRKLADALAGDEQVIKDAFQSRGMEKAAFTRMSGKAALTVLDQKVCDKMKRLNALKHTTQTCRRRLDQLQLQHQSVTPENGGGAQTDGHARPEEEATSEGEPVEEQPQKNVRVLENRLEKAQLKCQEAEHIMRGYLKLKAHLQEESLTFQPQLDRLEAQILRQRQELRGLQVMNDDAQLAKDAAKTELHHQEDFLYKERKERERVLTRYKKQAEERQGQAERVERRAQRVAMAPDDLSSEAQRSGAALGDEERGVSGFQDAFRRIKEATGVTDTREVVERFVSQGDTQKHLTLLKEENQRALTRLKQERDGLQESFQDMKYSGEAQLSSGQQTLEERERRLVAEEQSRDAARERLDWLSRTLGTACAGVEHLAHKLRHIELEEGAPPESSVDGEEEAAVAELLSRSERKLQLLWAELKGKDLAAVMKEMEEEEFHASIEGKLPHYNTRIKLPEAQKQDPYDEDEDSGGDDEGDIITRAMLKRQSQLIIDSKTKRKTRTKKKKGKL